MDTQRECVVSDITILILVGVVVGLGVLALLFYFFLRMLAIAALLFAWASDQGFVGIAAYVACWVFLFPIMVAVCLIGALFYSEEPASSPIPIPDDWEQEQWEREDREYEEAKGKLLATHDPETTNDIDKLIQAERKKLVIADEKRAIADEKRAKFEKHQVQRFQVMRTLLEEVVASVDGNYLGLYTEDADAYISVGSGADSPDDPDIQWRICPNSKQIGFGSLISSPGFVVAETLGYGGEDDEHAVAARFVGGRFNAHGRIGFELVLGHRPRQGAPDMGQAPVGRKWPRTRHQANRHLDPRG